jgi:hypothetical protein
VYLASGMKTSAYPTKATIARMIEAARASGLDVCGFETSPDGTIRVMEARAAPTVMSDFDRWQARL